MQNENDAESSFERLLHYFYSEVCDHTCIKEFYSGPLTQVWKNTKTFSMIRVNINIVCLNLFWMYIFMMLPDSISSNRPGSFIYSTTQRNCVIKRIACNSIHNLHIDSYCLPIYVKRTTGSKNIFARSVELHNSMVLYKV